MPQFTEYRLDIGLKEEIARAIDDDEDLINALTANLKGHDPRANYVDESFSVEEVTFEDDCRVRISYKFDWSAEYGCSDMCKYDSDCDSVFGHLRLRFRPYAARRWSGMSGIRERSAGFCKYLISLARSRMSSPTSAR